jgi:hypothetical protein
MPLPVAKHELFKNGDNQEVDEEEVNRQVPIAFRGLVENV